MSSWTYNAEVIRIVDGDTVDLKIDLGFRASFTDRFRLLGIDCPERGQEGWVEAKDALAQMIPAGSKISVTTAHPKVRDPRDGFGRWLAVIFVGVTNINRAMVHGGFAKEWVL